MSPTSKTTGVKIQASTRGFQTTPTAVAFDRHNAIEAINFQLPKITKKRAISPPGSQLAVTTKSTLIAPTALSCRRWWGKDVVCLAFRCPPATQ